MTQRIITGVVAGAVFLCLAILGGTPFHILVDAKINIILRFKNHKINLTK